MLGDLPPSLELSDEALEDLLSIVVANAVEAISEKGEIRISAKHATGEKFMMLTVEDTGQGMDTAVLQRVFEPFFSTKNLDRVNGVSIQGNGLGLWNAYHTLNLLGGDIRIESQKGRGTLVRMLVPIASMDSPSTPRELENAETSESIAPSRAG
jgi:signal transduction histidine kinase